MNDPQDRPPWLDGKTDSQLIDEALESIVLAEKVLGEARQMLAEAKSLRAKGQVA